MLLNGKQTAYTEQLFKSVDLRQKGLNSKKFYDCTFIKCDFSETVFKECSFYDCVFEGCNLSLMSIRGCSYSNVVFKDSKVIGVNWTEAVWPKIKIDSPLQFLKCAISHSTFLGLSLREIRIRECNAENVDFRDADLTRADFACTDLTGSLFMKTILNEADFASAKNYTIDVALNSVKKAKFSLPQAMSLLYSLDIDLV